MNLRRQTTQAQRVAEVAVNMPADLNNGALVAALNKAYEAGYEQATEDLATGILGGPVPHWLKRQGL